VGLQDYVRVTTFEQRVVQAIASFSTCLHLAQVPVGTMAARFETFDSIDDVTGHSPAFPARVIAAATTFFAQDPNPGELIIGRQVPGTAKVVTVTITTEDDGTWSFTLNGTTVSALAAGSTEQEIAEALHAQAEVIAATNNVELSTPTGGAFTITSLIAGDDFVVGALTVPGSGVGSTATTTANVAAEDPTTALNAIISSGGVFFGLTIESRTEAAIDLVATWASARKVQFWAQTSDMDVANAVTGNMASDLALLGYKNTDLTWHRDSTEFIDVATMSRVLARNFDASNSTTAFLSFEGITPDAGPGVENPLTTQQIANIRLHANTYTLDGGLGVRFPGQEVDGGFTDITISRFWVQTRAEEAVFGALVGAPDGLTFDLAGATVIENVLRGVCQTGVDARHFRPGFTVTVPDPETLTSAVRATRNLANCKITASYRGFIHTVEVPIYLSF
jgi:hypothetical protein